MLLPQYERYLERNQARPKTIRNYLAKVRIFVDWLEKQCVGVPEVDPDRIFGFHQYLLIERKQRASTRKTYLNALRSYYDFLMTQGIFKANPAKKVRMPKIHKTPPDQLSGEEITNILAEAFKKKTEKGMRDLAILAVLTGTACRVSALVGMRVQDFRPTDITIPEKCAHCQQSIVSGPRAGRGKKVKVIMVRLREKGGKEWDVILPAKSASFLSLYLKNRTVETDIVFATKWRGEIKPLSRHAVLYLVRRLATKAGIMRKVGPHSFRHAAITWFLDVGIDPDVVRQWAGHSALSQTMEYRNRSIRSFAWSGIGTDRNLLECVETPMDGLFDKML